MVAISTPAASFERIIIVSLVITSILTLLARPNLLSGLFLLHVLSSDIFSSIEVYFRLAFSPLSYWCQRSYGTV